MAELERDHAASGRLLSLSMSSEVIMCSAPGIGSAEALTLLRSRCDSHELYDRRPARGAARRMCRVPDHLDLAASHGAREAFPVCP
jgi:hypothetical protein